MNQAQRLADILHVPFGYLFLPNPPVEDVPLPDFRTVSGIHPQQLSADLIDLLDEVIIKQQWYREYLLNEGAEKLPFVASFSRDADPTDVAKNIRATLHLDENFRAHCTNWEDFLRNLIRRAETIGVLVMRSGVVEGNTRRPLSVEEFRGFAITDSIAPVIFINGRDALAAQIFTTAHELTHLWIGEGGISNEDLGDKRVGAGNDVEVLCNKTAAEVLLPQAEFESSWRAKNPLSDNIISIARRFRVSNVVVLRRAYDLNKINWNVFHQEFQKLGFAGKAKTSGGNYFNNVVSRNSARLTATVVEGTLSGRVLFRDAARLLNITVPSITKLANHLGRDGNRVKE